VEHHESALQHMTPVHHARTTETDKIDFNELMETSRGAAHPQTTSRA
jgi:hypothetical protein